jgi:hypothetical protein
MLVAVVTPAAAAPTTLSAVLSGLAEVPIADPDGAGTASVTADPEAGTLCYTVTATNIDLPVTMAHIHEGAAGTAPASNIRVHFTAAVGDADGTFNGCAANPADYSLPAGQTVQQFLTALVTNPSNYYVNVHNATYPAGAVRGQLGNTRLCGTVARNATTGVITVGATVVPAAATSAQVAALLTAAASANASVCVDVTYNAAGGVLSAVNVDATFTLCAAVTATGSGATRSFTIGGVAIPAAQLSAAEAAALELALTNQTNACLTLVIVDSALTSVAGYVDVCATVGAVSTTSVTLDGVAIPIGAGSNVSTDIRQGMTLTLRVNVDDTAVTITGTTLTGCTAPSAGALPDTSVAASAPASALVIGFGMVFLLGGILLIRRERSPA